MASLGTTPGDALTDQEILGQLARVPLFRELGPRAVARLARSSTRRQVPADTNIVEVGDPGHALFVVLGGEVDVLYPARSPEFRLARLGPGECFGEMALLNDMPGAATVRSTGAVEVLQLERSAFNQVLEESPTIARALLDVLSRRIQGADDQLGGLSALGMRDPLTRLLNRRAFQERLEEEVNRTRRYGEPFSLVLIDLDRFRKINDDVGQQAGDSILAWVGQILLEHTRQADSAYRVGGEEFAMLCPSSEGEVARAAADRVISVIAQAKPPVEVRMPVTMSAGYVSFPSDSQTPDGAFQAAGRALTWAKRTGRNRVCGPADVG